MKITTIVLMLCGLMFQAVPAQVQVGSDVLGLFFDEEGWEPCTPGCTAVQDNLISDFFLPISPS